MGRPATYTVDQVLDASRTLIVDSGPTAFSVSAVAGAIGAPSGSIYHRFTGRDDLVASLWLRAVERFQAGLFEALDAADPIDAATGAARYAVRWCRANKDDARLLLLYRSDDLLSEGWPDDLRARNVAQRRRLDRAMTSLCRRLGAVDRAARRRVQFAIMDIPYGAVRGPLAAGKAPDALLEALVGEASSAVLAGLQPRKEQP